MISKELQALNSLSQANEELRSRNEERVRVAKEALGSRHLTHPTNSPKKIDGRLFLEKYWGG